MTLQSALADIQKLPIKADNRVYIRDLERLAKKIGTNHQLALDLWKSGHADARELAIRLTDIVQVDEALLDLWVKDLDEWGLTDSFAGHLVRQTSYRVKKAHEWVKCLPEFERRAGFALIAQMAWSKNDIEDSEFIAFLKPIKDAATDERFYVKKAVNWALRDIGKRNETLHLKAQAVALELQKRDNKTARWVGTHRMKEIF